MSPTSRGILAALRTFVLIVCSLALAIPILRIGADWWVRRTLDVLPPQVLATQPTVTAQITGTPEETVAIRNALAQLRLPRLPPLRIAVDSQDANAGTFDVLNRDIVIDRSVVGDPVALQSTVAHEVGHVVDAVYLDAAERRNYERFRHMPPLNWRSPGLRWNRRPDEDFAECFAAVSQPYVSANVATKYGNIDAAALERFLATTGVVLPPPTPPRNYVEAIERELAYDAEVLGHGVTRLAILGILAAETAILMYGSYRRASTRGRGRTVVVRRVRTRRPAGPVRPRATPR